MNRCRRGLAPGGGNHDGDRTGRKAAEQGIGAAGENDRHARAMSYRHAEEPGRDDHHVPAGEEPRQGQESNWLPALNGPFYLLLRNYAPAAVASAALRDLAAIKPLPPIVPAEAAK
jgi:hypothetical protein